MKRCPACAEEIQDEATLCRFCRTPLSGSAPQGSVAPATVIIQQGGGSTSGMAVASMVLGILWIYWIGSLLAVIFGHLALGKIKNSPGLQGRGMAIAGVTLGWVGLGFLILVIFVAIGRHR